MGQSFTLCLVVALFWSLAVQSCDLIYFVQPCFIKTKGDHICFTSPVDHMTCAGAHVLPNRTVTQLWSFLQLHTVLFGTLAPFSSLFSCCCSGSVSLLSSLTAGSCFFFPPALCPGVLLQVRNQTKQLKAIYETDPKCKRFDSHSPRFVWQSTELVYFKSDFFP